MPQNSTRNPGAITSRIVLPTASRISWAVGFCIFTPIYLSQKKFILLLEMTIAVQVECYAGYKADERPVRFHLGDRTLDVQSVEDQWYSPSEVYFRVIASDGNTYILGHDEGQDRWTLQVFVARRP